MSIDYGSLGHSVLEHIDESICGEYDVDSLLRTAEIVWDGTAVQVKGKDFTMVFDLIDYGLLDYTGYDA